MAFAQSNESINIASKFFLDLEMFKGKCKKNKWNNQDILKWIIKPKKVQK